MRNILQRKFEPVPPTIAVFCSHNHVLINETVMIWHDKHLLAMGTVVVVFGDHYMVTTIRVKHDYPKG